MAPQKRSSGVNSLPAQPRKQGLPSIRQSQSRSRSAASSDGAFITSIDTLNAAVSKHVEGITLADAECELELAKAELEHTTELLQRTRELYDVKMQELDRRKAAYLAKKAEIEAQMAETRRNIEASEGRRARALQQIDDDESLGLRESAAEEEIEALCAEAQQKLDSLVAQVAEYDDIMRIVAAVEDELGCDLRDDYENLITVGKDLEEELKEAREKEEGMLMRATEAAESEQDNKNNMQNQIDEMARQLDELIAKIDQREALRRREIDADFASEQQLAQIRSTVQTMSQQLLTAGQPLIGRLHVEPLSLAAQGDWQSISLCAVIRYIIGRVVHFHSLAKGSKILAEGGSMRQMAEAARLPQASLQGQLALEGFSNHKESFAIYRFANHSKERNVE